MEIEIYLAKLYKRKYGWRFTILEIQNFDNGMNWSLLSFDYDRKVGFAFTLLD